MFRRAIDAAVRQAQYDDYSIVTAVFKKYEDVEEILEEVDALEEDGSNWTSWMAHIGRAIEYITGVEDYLVSKHPQIHSAVGLVIDRCALDVIRRTLPSTLNDEISTCTKAHPAKFRLRRHLNLEVPGNQPRSRINTHCCMINLSELGQEDQVTTGLDTPGVLIAGQYDLSHSIERY
ncbi:uncharacterized protein MELLADRAFT_105462 [Melampsora larici-populina 98AG31]|uniref:Uncharacterized protein n=1 Tax=Melampsora larici-populina (strain 98AG31 / pathotype 3-4-7) TaxID=747676 RepID=F4RI75_MELLP|nr:uncharacterized protein MELLADRAFT_105462 [Melampsora larici-populina 98AG31]EGG08012.1 hypothetical protein MELLADRAFT_105462 [Melampsora larici-populina 98AG31]